jgi:hypothetical protein
MNLRKEAALILENLLKALPRTRASSDQRVRVSLGEKIKELRSRE